MSERIPLMRAGKPPLQPSLLALRFGGSAARGLSKLKSRGLRSAGQLAELKLRWLEGQINAELGELERAEQALRDVKEGFEEAELGTAPLAY